ncbi:MAG: hypothetical protein ACREH9_08510, partial [Pseudomonadota bacterium]
MIAGRLSAAATALILCLIGLSPKTYGATGEASSTATQTQSGAASVASSANAAAPESAEPTAAATSSAIPAISANPGAVEIIPGTGALGRLAGFTPASGVRIGGFWIGNADYLVTGGVKPRSWSFNSAFLLNLNLDAEKLIGLPGGSFDVALLQLNL